MLTKTTYKSKWVNEILALQKADGSWGRFHTMSAPDGKDPLTTEQALRRLKILGLTEKDEPIQRALRYTESCLSGENKIPDHEKCINYDIFSELMLATWIKIFSPQNQLALKVAKKWADIAEAAFSGGKFDQNLYNKTYNDIYGENPNHRVLLNISIFYQLSLLQGMLKPETEKKVLEYVINHDTGIGYIYSYKIADPPKVFASRQTNRYLTALEILSGYTYTKEYLGFAVKWINDNRGEDGFWDMGASVKDGMNFPLSDTWGKEDRKKDSTLRIEKLLVNIKKN